MSLKKIIVISLPILLCFFILAFVPLFKFEPLQLQEMGRFNKLIPVEIKDKQAFNQKLKDILAYYEEIYIEINNEIFVSVWLYFDDDLRWNYTTKALDENFVLPDLKSAGSSK